MNIDELRFIRQCFEKFSGELSGEHWDKLRPFLQINKIRDHRVVFNSKTDPPSLVMLVNGAALVRRVDIDLISVDDFLVEGDVFVSHSTLDDVKGGYFEVETVEVCQYLVFPLDVLRTIFIDSLFVERFLISVSDYVIQRHRMHRRLFIYPDAKSRYDFLVDKNPHIVRRFKQKDISSYIGITPESLSRCKSNSYE